MNDPVAAAILGALLLGLASGGDAICQEGAIPGPTVEVLEVRGISGIEVTVRVENPGAAAISLISPEAPAVVLESKGCSFTLSSDPTKGPWPFDFRPELVELAGESTMTFKIQIAEKRLLYKRCDDWRISVELAYLSVEDAERVKGLPRGQWLQFMKLNRRLVLSTAAIFGVVPTKKAKE